MTETVQWLRWSRELIAIAQTGLHFAPGRYDRERYEAVRRIGSEIMAGGMATGAGVDDIVASLTGDVGYATPKVDVRAAVIHESKILLVREVCDGGWTMPGGWADVGDPPSAAAVRETREESGFEVRATKLIAVLDRERHEHPPIPHHSYKLFFLCERVGGEAKTSVETDQVEWFAPGELPPLSLARVLPWQIEMAFEHARNPELPTRFD